MTSISSATSSSSALSLLQTELSSEVSSGEISSTDATALSSALKDIDTALKSQSSSGTSAGDVKSKVDDLIDAEVKDGKLTSEQASELKNVFAQAFGSSDQASSTTETSATSSDIDASAGASSSSSSSSSSTDPADTNGDGVVTAAEQAAYDAKMGKTTSSSSSGTAGSSDLLNDFLAALRASKETSSGYTASGGNAGSKVASQVVDYQT